MSTGRLLRSAGSALLAAVALLLAACDRADAPQTLTVSGSAVGREADILRRQLVRFQQAHPSRRVELRPTPDSADERHQLYVQWLNAHAGEPDVLQLDVIWTAEFAAAGWIVPLDRFEPDLDAFFPAAVEANRWSGRVYALPWFVDVGMLYWRRDLMTAPPANLPQLKSIARRAQDEGRTPYGLVWQGARYEGLVTVFLEYLGAFGGRILSDDGQVVVDSEAAVRALTEMRDEIHADGIVPPAVLAWQEEHVRLAFQNGEAAFMRNWPYAIALVEDPASAVAGRVGVAPMPASVDGRSSAALGGSQLAVNAFSDDVEVAYELVRFLLEPAQMLERTRLAGQFPSRSAMYDTSELAAVLPAPAADVRRIIEQAVPRPVTPVYSQLSELLQVSLHRALTRQQAPRTALAEAAASIRALLSKVKLAPDTT